MGTWPKGDRVLLNRRVAVDDRVVAFFLISSLCTFFLLIAWPAGSATASELRLPSYGSTAGATASKGSSRAVRIIGGSGVVAPMDVAFLDAVVHGKWCRLSVAKKGRKASGPLQRVRAKHLRATWRVPLASGSGRSTITIRCSRSKALKKGARSDSLTLVVRGGQGRDLPVHIRKVKLAPVIQKGEGDLEGGLPEGNGNPDDFGVNLPEGVGGGGFGTYWPLSQGTRTRITQGPGGAASHSDQWNRYAVDLGVPFGTQVRAGFYGVVARVNTACAPSSIGCGGGYGNYVLLKAADGTCAIHGHLSKVQVQLGQQVKTYDPIGLTGNTGTSYGTHLHYGRVNCTSNVSLPWSPIEGGSLSEGTSIASQNRPGGQTSTNGFQTAFQANTGVLIRLGDAGGWNTSQGMKLGTSPSIARLSDGRLIMAFQANTGDLVVLGEDGGVNTGQGMMAGTSPSIAASPKGGYRVAFQANNGSLYVYDSSRGPSNQGQGMKAGTSPAITALANGGYEMAFQANTGALYVFGDGPKANTQQGMMAGTSPDIASNGNNFRVAFQANNGNLYTFDSRSGAASQGQGMKAGTSPAIAPLGAGFEMAFQANTGALFLFGDGPRVNTGQGMLAGTSPDIATSGSAYRVAFQVNTGNLFVHDSAAGTVSQGQGMKSGTSPSIAPQ